MIMHTFACHPHVHFHLTLETTGMIWDDNIFQHQAKKKQNEIKIRPEKAKLSTTYS